MKGAVFADAGSLWDYQGPTTLRRRPARRSRRPTRELIRSSVGAGLIWDSPFGPLRFDYASPAVTKESLRPGAGSSGSAAARNSDRGGSPRRLAA